MAYDPRIILAGQAPDVVGSLARGTQAAGLSNDVMRHNRLAQVYQEHGPGIMAGEAPALNRLAQIDPMAGLGVQQTRQQMRVTEEQLRITAQNAGLRAAELARGLSADQRAQAEATFRRGAEMLAAAQTPEQFAQIAQMPGVAETVEQFVGPGMLSFENRSIIAAAAMGAAEAMKVTGGQASGFRRATPEEAQQYGAAAGQFGPDGRFYPVNPPSGFTVETGPDGQMRVAQGPGVTTRPGGTFTEGQSKDNVYLTRATGALGTLNEVEEALTSTFDTVAGNIPIAGNFMVTEDFQRARVAGREFLQAILRKDTGAAITAQEVQEYGMVYLPAPGDTPETLRHKRMARQRALDAIAAGMSPEQMLAVERGLAGARPAASGAGRPDEQSAGARPEEPPAFLSPQDAGLWPFATPQERRAIMRAYEEGEQ